MASLKYFTKGTGDLKTIYVRLIHGRNYDFTKSTGLLINPKYWNNKKGTVKPLAEFKDKKNLQNNLNDLRGHILNSFNTSYANGQLITANWLKNAIDVKFDQNKESDFTYLVDYAEYFKRTLPNKIQESGKMGVTSSTLNKYQTIINKIKDFEKYKKKRLKVVEVDLKFHKDFIYFLHDIQLLSYNTTGRYLKFIKTIVKSAKDYGIKVSADIDKKEFRYPKEKTTFITLNESEINRIFNHDFKTAPYLANARDWLIIGVWTGARVSDLLNFDNGNIKNGFIEYTAKKTGQKIVLPLHSQVKETIIMNDNQFPRKISSQRFNDYIKVVCKDAGLTELVNGAKSKKLKPKVWRKQKGKFPKWELVSTHICRRSFATNHYGKLPTPVIMAITGHTTEKMFLNYIGKTAKDNAEVLNSFWEVQEQKKNKETMLNLIKTGTNE